VNPKLIKALAVALLAASIAAAGFALYASSRAIAIQGPGALVATAADELWIAVDQRLWRVDAQGRRLSDIDVRSTGLPGAPANLVRHPSGAIVATVRDDATLYFLATDSQRVDRSLRPQWPASLARDSGRAINLAFADDGRIAIATGGGHAVALFDADGKFLARTAPGTYRFTNGLWWQGAELWTTDTNRHRLLRLDAKTLAVLETATLDEAGCCRFLGAARAESHGSTSMRTALIRFTSNMTRGEVVLVEEGATVRPLAGSGVFEPRDTDWLQGRLLVSDGESHSIRQWATDLQALPAFGDVGMQAELSNGLAQRDAWRGWYRAAIASAIGVFAVAFALAVWTQLQQRRAERGASIDLSQLGTPQRTWRDIAKMQWHVFGALIVPLIAILALKLLPRSETTASMRITGFAVVAVLLVVTCLIVSRRAKRAQSAEFEPMWNQLAMSRLVASDAKALGLAADEPVLETFVLRAPMPRWVVLTDRRLLVFRLNGFGQRLERAIPRTSIVAISDRRGTLRPARGLFRMADPMPGRWLELDFADGQFLAGTLPAASLAKRVTQLLAADAEANRIGPTHDSVAESSLQLPPITKGPSPRLAAALSAIVPGLGQAMQGRTGTALLLFVLWLVVMLFAVLPIAWALIGPKREVSTLIAALTFVTPLVVAAVAAFDAWNMAPRGRGN
jgi:hypothetical protein